MIGNDLNGQGMQALIDEILHCIIHKPVACHAALARKRRAGNANAEVRTKSLRVRASMAGMGGAFVEHFKPGRLKPCPELLLNFLDAHRQGGPTD